MWLIANLFLFFSTIWSIILTNFGLFPYSLALMLIMCFVSWTVLVDNVQGVYLSIVIFQWAKSNHNAQIKGEFKTAMLFNLVLILLDWAAVILVFLSTDNAVYANISVGVTGIHCFGIVLVFQVLKEMALSKNKTKGKTATRIRMGKPVTLRKVVLNNRDSNVIAGGGGGASIQPKSEEENSATPT